MCVEITLMYSHRMQKSVSVALLLMMIIMTMYLKFKKEGYHCIVLILPHLKMVHMMGVAPMTASISVVEVASEA